MHDIGARGPQPAAEPRPAAISAGCGPFFIPRPATARPQLFCRGCGPFVPAFVALRHVDVVPGTLYEYEQSSSPVG
jgi:hypothetical protein